MFPNKKTASRVAPTAPDADPTTEAAATAAPEAPQETGADPKNPPPAQQRDILYAAAEGLLLRVAHASASGANSLSLEDAVIGDLRAAFDLVKRSR